MSPAAEGGPSGVFARSGSASADPDLAQINSALTLPMLPYADANLANQVGAVPDIDG